MVLDLAGLRVLNTRPFGQHQQLTQVIQAAGGVSVELPALSIEPVPLLLADLPEALSHLDYLIFISTNAVRYFFSALELAHCPYPVLARTLAIGPATARALSDRHVYVEAVPLSSTSEDFLQLALMQQVRNQTIMVIKGEGGRQLLLDTLAARGATVVALDVYRRVKPSHPREWVESLWHEDAIDVIVLTSEQALYHLFDLFGDSAHDWLRSKLWLVISERLAQAAIRFGIKRVDVTRW